MTGAYGTSPSYLDWLPTAAAADTADAEPVAAADPAQGVVVEDGPTAPAPIIVVAGAHGGSGTSVVALLLAMVSDDTVVVLDGTPVGGDISRRTPAPVAQTAAVWGVWLTGDRALPTSTGWTVLGRDRRDDASPSHLAAAVTAARAAGGGHGLVVVDAGACIGSTWFDAAADLADHIVVTIDDRPGAANAARPVLTELHRRLGIAGMGRSVQLVVTSQRPGVDHVTGPLADALTGRVAGVVHLPYDAELAAGVGIDPSQLSAAALAAAIAVLSGSRAHLHREAHRP